MKWGGVVITLGVDGLVDDMSMGEGGSLPSWVYPPPSPYFFFFFSKSDMMIVNMAVGGEGWSFFFFKLMVVGMTMEGGVERAEVILEVK